MLEGISVLLANAMMLWTSLRTLLLELIKPKAGHDPAQLRGFFFPRSWEKRWSHTFL